MSIIFERGGEKVMVTEGVNPGIVVLDNKFLRVKKYSRGEGHVVDGKLTKRPSAEFSGGARLIQARASELTPRKLSDGWVVYFKRD